MFKQITSLIFTLFYQMTALAECIKSPQANKQIIYLHGLDDPSPTPQELQNRELLKKLAQKLNFNLWIARSQELCKNNKLCWPHQNIDMLKTIWQRELQKAKDCIHPNQGFGIIGFSNGGYFATKLSQNCLDSNLKWVLAIGSAGYASKQICAPIHLNIGERDITLKKTLSFYEVMKKEKQDVTLRRFNGGHELKEKELADMLPALP